MVVSVKFLEQLFNSANQGIPWRSSVWDSAPSQLRAQVQSLGLGNEDPTSCAVQLKMLVIIAVPVPGVIKSRPNERMLLAKCRRDSYLIKHIIVFIVRSSHTLQHSFFHFKKEDTDY